jgi:hypothetical protein
MNERLIRVRVDVFLTPEQKRALGALKRSRRLARESYAVRQIMAERLDSMVAAAQVLEAAAPPSVPLLARQA